MVLDTPPSVCAERACLITRSYRETAGQPTILRRAHALATILSQMSIFIQPGELIVGNQASKPRAAPIFPEYSVNWLLHEMDELSERRLDRFVIDEDAKSRLREACPYWVGRTHQDYVAATLAATWPPELLPALDLQGFHFNQVIRSVCTDNGDGHATPHYERLLRFGLRSVVAEAMARNAALDLSQPEAIGKRLFYQAVVTSCTAAKAFANRYADLALRLAKEGEPERRNELEETAAICRKVPAEPVQTFREALQSVWLLHLILQIESNGHSMPLGRMDQYLYPYYRADLDAGRLTREQALELCECFLVKCSELNKIRPWASTQFRSGYPMFQTVTLGGQTEDGQDATNDLTYLFLEASGNMKLPQPTVVVRVHNGTPDDLLMASARSLLAHGGGIPGFFNDEVIIPSLTSKGISLGDARNWSEMGCAEPQVMGKFLPAARGVCYFNLLKALEVALNGGANPATGLCPHPGRGDLTTFKSFEEVMAAYREQVEFYAKFVPLFDNITSQAFAQLNPCPFLSSVLDHRLEVGRDAAEAGGANYHLSVTQGHGTADVGNSLAAIKKLVFEERRLDAADLKEALATNFSGARGEQIRQALVNWAPKFGNDDDYVDALTKEAVDIWAKAMHRLTNVRGQYGPTTQTLTSNVPEGFATGATPDGRRACEPLADNNSPAAGTDLAGPTAAAKSVAKLDHYLLTCGTIFNVKMHPTALEGLDRLRKFCAFVRTFFHLKGSQVQFNVLSAEVLRDAQEHPENYRSLVVKVAGYSALFSALDKRLQDQIIERTSHSFS